MTTPTVRPPMTQIRAAAGSPLPAVPRQRFLQVVKTLGGREPWSHVSAQQRQTFRESIEDMNGSIAGINYSIHADIFNSSFFYKHILKSLILEHYMPPQYKPILRAASFVDIGSGAAPLSLALSLSRNSRPQQLCLVEKSARQIKSAIHVLEIFNQSVLASRGVYPDDIFLREQIVGGQYFLCENEGLFHDISKQVSTKNIQMGVFVDYYSVLERFNRVLRSDNIRGRLANGRWALPRQVRQIVGQDVINLSVLYVRPQSQLVNG